MKKLQAFIVCLVILSLNYTSSYALNGVGANSVFKQSRRYENALYNLLLNLKRIAMQGGYHELRSDVTQSLVLLDRLHKTIPYNNKETFDEVKESYQKLITFFDKRSLITPHDVMKFGQLCDVTYHNLKRKNFIFSIQEQKWMSNFESFLTLITSRITAHSSLRAWHKAYKGSLLKSNGIWHQYKSQIITGSAAVFSALALYYVAHQKNTTLADTQKNNKNSLVTQLVGETQNKRESYSAAQLSFDTQVKRENSSGVQPPVDAQVKEENSLGAQPPDEIQNENEGGLDTRLLLDTHGKDENSSGDQPSGETQDEDGNSSGAESLVDAQVKDQDSLGTQLSGETHSKDEGGSSPQVPVDAHEPNKKAIVQPSLPDIQVKEMYASLDRAARSGDDQVIRSLIDKGINVTIKIDTRGNTALINAARSGKDSTVKLLMPYFAKANMLNAQNIRGNNALTLAAVNCDGLTVKALLDNNAYVTLTNTDGNTALHYAAYHGKSSMVQLLTPYFAKAKMLNAQNVKGKTALTFAALDCDDTTVQTLLAADADVTTVDNNGNTVLIEAACNGRSSLVQRLIPYFVNAGAINARNGNGSTALNWAVIRCDDATVKALLDAGADVTITDRQGNTDLINAAHNRKSLIVQLLIPYFVKMGLLNVQNGNNSTALMVAASKGDSASVKALIDAGADVTKINKQRKTALDLARENKCNDCVKILVDAGAK